MSNIILYPHNQVAYESVTTQMKDRKKIAIVQPTGTGKSYLLTKIFENFKGRKLLLSPSNYINEQIEKICPVTYQDVNTMNYQKLSMKNEELISSMHYDLIVLDEFHRCGALVWGLSIRWLLNANPHAYVIGTSATPIRYLDENRDMAEELFDNNLAVNMSLVDAIRQKILPAPTYIRAVYDYEEIFEKMHEKIKKSYNEKKEKKQLVERLKKIRKHLENSQGMDQVLKKHFSLKQGKTIVFCKSKEHLEEMVPVVEGWFRKAFKDASISTYRVHSGFSDAVNQGQLFLFEKNTKEGICLLFTIAMLNEGLHIPGMSNAIFLRSTESRAVFLQQLGRVLTVNKNIRPIVFDLVNNLNNIDADDFKNELESLYFSNHNLSDDDLEDFYIHDEITSLEKTLSAISTQLKDYFDIGYDTLIAFKKENGHMEVPSRYQCIKTGFKLGNWVYLQRNLYQNDALSDERIQRLEIIGFDFQRQYFDRMWEDLYGAFCDYVKKHGHGYVYLKKDSPSQNTLASWCARQRHLFYEGILSHDKALRLSDAGFVWDKGAFRTHYRLELLKEAYEKGIEINSLNQRYKGINLYLWLLEIRALNKEQILDQEIIDTFLELGISLEPIKKTWEESYGVLVDFFKTHTTDDLFYNTVFNDYAIGQWVFAQKTEIRKGNLSKDKIALLLILGIDGKKTENKIWAEKIALYESYLKHPELLTKKQIESIKGWETKQRGAKKNKTLAAYKIKDLDRLGFNWDVNTDKTWDESYQLLVDYYKKYHHTSLKPKELYKDYKLGQWVLSQRKLKKKDKLSKAQVEKLDEIGFVWDKLAFDWQKRYEEILSYYQIQGFIKKEDLDWVYYQVKRNKKGRLSLEQKKKLILIGVLLDE